MSDGALSLKGNSQLIRGNAPTRKGVTPHARQHPGQGGRCEDTGSLGAAPEVGLARHPTKKASAHPAGVLMTISVSSQGASLACCYWGYSFQSFFASCSRICGFSSVDTSCVIGSPLAIARNKAARDLAPARLGQVVAKADVPGFGDRANFLGDPVAQLVGNSDGFLALRMPALEHHEGANRLAGRVIRRPSW